MQIAIYPGTFDPITKGHIDVLEKATKIFDKVILAVAFDNAKMPLFTLSEREGLCRKSLEDFPKVEVQSFQGLVVNFAKKVGATAMIRGLRAVSDFEYELSLALMNKNLCDEIETVFFVPKSKYLYISSTMIREVVSLGGDTLKYVPICVDEALRKKNS
ncbi:MAG: pantetheine-phosphate adenylyltransferase [Candidatus Cloacimonetes bacterium]|jgi:pantetheine-phosphate adenylyltransferase|nr:pantetheine-phosphate adenylyltransferase [Candidatus Cloacimonadota bacterium]MBT6994989.1 pantetheine-phosphate adenylyltransferase [Candidatus Cloacimonadota bacterium]MBT7469848.1 pantetheine-phosphate adenylyltransferase [Candidatus Cloacimonadota bacterium]